MAGIAKNHGMNAIAIGGVADHAHALVNLGSTLSIAKAVQVLKANSSRWMNERPEATFEWQEGYFACSVSQSQLATIRRYITTSPKDGFKAGIGAAAEKAQPQGIGLSWIASNLWRSESEGRSNLWCCTALREKNPNETAE